MVGIISEMKNDLIRQGLCATYQKPCSEVASSEWPWRPSTIYCYGCAKLQTVRDLYSGEEAMPSIDGDKGPVEDYHTLVRDFSIGDKTMANFEPMFGATDVGNPMDKQSYRALANVGPTKEQELMELIKSKDTEIVALQHAKGYLKIAIFIMAIVAVVSSTAILMLK